MANRLISFSRDLAQIPEGITSLRDPEGRFIPQPRSRLISKDNYSLGALVGEDDIQGFRVTSPRLSKQVTVRDAQGVSRYDGAHDEIVGLYRPQEHWNFPESIDGKLNPAIATHSMVAFRDGDKVNVYSADGNEFNNHGKQVPLFGGDFDEVYPDDIFVDVASVSLRSTTGDRRYVDDIPVTVLAMRYVLGKKNDTWGLYDMQGKCAVEGEKEQLLNIQGASAGKFEPMQFYSIDFNTPAYERPDVIQGRGPFAFAQPEALE